MLERLAARLAGCRVPEPDQTVSASGESRLSSGLNATETTGPRCRIGSPRGKPDAVFHNRAVWSSEPVASVLPSRVKATARTAPACLSLIDDDSIERAVGSQSRTLPSPPPVAMARPVGLQAMTRSGASCSRQSLRRWTSGLQAARLPRIAGSNGSCWSCALFETARQPEEPGAAIVAREQAQAPVERQVRGEPPQGVTLAVGLLLAGLRDPARSIRLEPSLFSPLDGRR